ncbi:MAG: hypothetical protein UT30_C0018G0010 [Candidatus Uhrbacteria bacterium GW2011_GWF2_39_13]|uniref:Uncharacterized protein n=1 Tax=Candidatus Uhrbacteria bacterium GW2011_GWF2_39_13 TaxID=1618995 RepID=A0A0G0MTT4_9BACT|nr:MAG: hypothetical protein UT30_C0018G0010 [Candidatus Uhrbacteria bacterium GW2011_GWF2_39_13]HAU65936.1 hypothetical protein [Candidatus Uhrbacteria bacterium]
MTSFAQMVKVLKNKNIDVCNIYIFLLHGPNIWLAKVGYEKIFRTLSSRSTSYSPVGRVEFAAPQIGFTAGL